MMKLSKVILSLLALALMSVTVFAQKETKGESYLLNNTNGGVGINNVISVTHRDPGDIDIVIDVTGVESMELIGDALNDIVIEALGEGAIMTGVGWDVTIDTSTYGFSWLSEAKIYFDASDQDGFGLYLTPGAGVNSSGIGSYSEAMIDLTDVGIADIPILADGNLYMEFYEDYNDNAGAIDAMWSGTITLRVTAVSAVPTMSEYALIFFIFAIGVLGVIRMRRA